MGAIFAWIFFGLFIGAVARLLVPGPHRIGCLGTIALGVAGSFVGGMISTLFAGNPLKETEPAHFLMSIVGAIVVLLIATRFGRPAP